MTLVEYVASLQDQNIPESEWFDKVQQWKKENNYEDPNLVKKKDVAGRMDATATSTETPGASENLESGNGNLESTGYDPMSFVFDQMNTRLENAILMDARRSLEKAGKDYVDYSFKISKDIENRVPLAEVDPPEEEVIPAYFTQERKDYYDSKGWAYDDTIIEIKQDEPVDIDFKQQAVEKYEESQGTLDITLQPKDVAKYKIFGADYDYSQNRSARKIKFEDFLILPEVEKEALALVNQTKDPSFFEFNDDDIYKEAANKYFRLDDIKARNAVRTSAGAGAAYGAAPEFSSDQEYEDYLKNQLGEEKYNEYKEYLKSGRFNASGREIDNAINELSKKKLNQFMYAQGNDALRFVYSFYDNEIRDSKVEAAQLKNIENDLQKNMADVDNQQKELESVAKPIVENINTLQKKASNLRDSVDKFEESQFFSPLNPAYVKAKEEYNDAIEKYQEAYNEYFNSALYQKTKTLNQDVKSLNFRLSKYVERAEIYNEETEKVAFIEKALGLDYTNWAKVTNSLYNTFIKDTGNFLNLSGQMFLKALNSAAPTKTPELGVAVYNMQQNMYNYNKDIAAWTDANIAPSLKLEDVGKEGVTFFDYASGAVSDQTGTIALGLSYLLTGGATAGLRSGSSFAARRAAKVALDKQVALQSRIVANTFFAVETGSKIGEMTIEKFDAKQAINKYNEMRWSGNYTDDQLEDMFGDYDDLRRKSNYTFNQMAFNSYAYGTVAKYAEKFGTLRLPSVLRQASKRTGIDQVLKTKIYKNPFQTKFLYTAKGVYQGFRPLVTKALPTEVFEEFITAVGHNVLDYYILDENKSFLEGIDADFFSSVALSSFAMMGPGSMQNVFTTIKSDFRSIDEITSNIKIKNELNQLSLLIPSLKGARLRQAKKRKREILREFALNEVSTIQKLNKLSAEEIFEIAEASRMQRDLARQARLIGVDGATDKASRDEIAKLNEEYSRLEKVKDNLLNTKKREMLLKAQKIREQSGRPSVIDVEYNLGLYDMAVDVAGVLMNTDGNLIQISAKDGAILPSKQEVIQMLKEGGYKGSDIDSLAEKISLGEVNAVQAGNDIIINDAVIQLQIYAAKNKSDAEYAAISPIEEIFHLNVKSKNLRDKNGNLSDQATQAIEDTIKILKQNKDSGVISEQDYNDLLERFNLYRNGKGKVVLKTGERGKAGVDIEEVMAQMNNANILGKINAGDLKKNPTIKMFLNSVISSIMGDSSWFMELKTSDDVLNFLDKFKQRYESRNIMVSAEPEKLEEVDLGTVKKSITQINPEEQAAGYQVTKQASDFVEAVKDGLMTNEQLIEIAKPETRATPEQRIAAQDALLEANWPIISKSIKFDPSGQIPQPFIKLAVQEMFRDTFPGRGVEAKFFDKFDPKLENKATTFIDSQLRNRIPEILERAKVLQSEKQDLGIEKAGGVIDTDTTKTVTTKETKVAKKPTETVKYSDAIIEKAGVKDKAELEAKITKATKESFKDVDVERFGQTKDVPPAVAKIYGDMLGLNPETISDKTRTYQNYDEAGLNAAQRFLLANATNDYARLPKTKDETTTTGRGTFIPKNMKDALYTDGRLTGTLKDYMDLIRSKPTGKLYRDSKYAQLIRGLLNTHIRNRMFEDLVTTTPQRLRGGAKFNRAKGVKNLFQELPFIKVKDDFSTLNNFRWGAILQATLKGSGVSPIDMKTEEGRKRFKDYAVSSGMISKFPKDFWRSMQGTTENLLKDKTKKFGEAVKETREFVESLIKDPDVVIDESQFRGYTGNLPFRSVKEVDDWIAETEANGGVFAKDSQLFSDMLKKENPTAKRLPMEKALNDPAFIKRQENSINGLKKVFEIFQDAMDTPEGIAFVAAIMSSSGASQNHFIRKSAPWKFYQKGYLDQPIREEHTLPASLIGKYLFMSALEGTVSSDFKNVKKNFFQGALLKTNDDKLKGFKPTGGKYNYVESTPEGWKITDNIWARYFNINVANTEGGINPQSIMLANNKSVFDLFNVTTSGLKLNKQGVKNVPKVEKALDAVLPKSMESRTKISAQQNVFNQGVLDNALNMARRPNAPVKKIRVFDFDDTLAKSKSQVIYTVPNAEGGFSEGSTKLKAIFMVGGPGAGKTNVGKGLQLGRRGYKVVNQDIALEAMKQEAGLPAKESDYTAEQRSTRSKLGAAARKAAVAKFDKYAAAGNGMVIDGTGASYNATTKKIKALQDAGYEVHMVVATTPLETAIERNKARAERSLPDFVVKKTYDQVQESLARYREDFGDRLYEINTETIEYGKPLPNDFLQQVYAGINANKVNKINATQFAEQASDLEAQGAEFDFREFSRVIEGKKGPLFSVAQKIAAARGTDDIFILTARPADAAGPIQAFMKANGIDIPLKNITGLGDGTAAAKGRWIAGKAAEGYNDFYFADDAVKNVQAVKDVLSQVDVKSKVQQAKFSKTKILDEVFNDIIEAKTGIESYKQFSAAKAKTVGANKGKFGFFIPASAEDFTGLLYRTLGKGKVGDAQMAFYKENLIDPYNRAEMAISQAKVAAGRDYKELKKQFKNIPKTLEKETGVAKYSYQHAIRTYIWDSQGLEVPGLSKRDQKRLTDFIKADPELQAFADQLVNLQKGKPYPKPDKNWTAGNITTDVISGINKVNRAEYLQEWQENVDIIFSEKNMNKLEAAFGVKYVEALKDSLRAMKSGSNRPLGGDRISNRILDWTNNSIGAVMFLNTRSAVLQTISSVNFINWGDNNLYAAGKAFANQKQYWKDFLTLMNSDYLLERRDGLKINVSESEIADAVENSKNKVTAAISYLLNKGFVFTRYADSFAIASGGATFYRNRIKSLMKEGMSQELAEQQAFEDFRLIAEENQQSSSPMRISQQQRSTIGRMVLAFGNTQMQYARIQKRAIQDLVNGRGDWRTNISRIVYYGAIQNLMFNALQSGLTWALFDDDEDEKAKEQIREEKLQRTLNGMIDSQLKGLGIAGAVTAGVKNALMTIAEEAGKKSPEFEKAVDDLINIMPAIGSKVRKLKSAARTMSWNRKEIKAKGFSLDNPAYLAGAQVISGVTNIPVDEAAMKINTMRNILNPYTEAWQKVALTLGWSTWDVNLPYWGLAEEKPVLTETEKQVKKLFDLNKSDQVKMLLDLGLTKKEIRALAKEQQRVDEIIKLQNKKKDGKNKP